MLKHLDLFSGIGGFALAAYVVGGIETKQFVEINPYCQKVLAKNFPGVPMHGDITTYTCEPGRFDIITGGFPCQDISISNPNGRGLEGKRSGLFFELMRVVRECRPRYVVLENVAEMLRKQRGRVMGTVLWELSQSGYDAEWQTISAASMGAPHLRERIFIVAANRDGKRCNSGQCNRGERSVHSNEVGDLPEASSNRERLLSVPGATRQINANPNRSRCEELNTPSIAAIEGYDTWSTIKRGAYWGTEPGILRVANGIPNRVDRVAGCGNAIVPQCGAVALRRVLELDRTM